MKLKTKLLFTLFTIILTQACSAPFYDHTREDWNKLTYEQRKNIKNSYKTVIDSRKITEHDEIIKARTQSIIKLAN